MKLNEWLKSVKSDAQRRTVDELMRAVDTLEAKVAKNEHEAKAIDLMIKIYDYEIQERLWEV